MLDREAQAGLPQALIESALEACQQRAREARSQVEHWQATLSAITHETRLLEELLSLRRNGTDEFPGKGQTEPFLQEGRRHPSCERTVLLLAEAGRPLHISELMRILNEEGVDIPGAGIQANLIAHLTRDPRIFRPARGMYGLAVWDIAASMSRPTSRRKSRKAKPRARAAKAAASK